MWRLRAVATRTLEACAHHRRRCRRPELYAKVEAHLIDGEELGDADAAHRLCGTFDQRTFDQTIQAPGGTRAFNPSGLGTGCCPQGSVST